MTICPYLQNIICVVVVLSWLAKHSVFATILCGTYRYVLIISAITMSIVTAWENRSVIRSLFRDQHCFSHNTSNSYCKICLVIGISEIKCIFWDLHFCPLVVKMVQLNQWIFFLFLVFSSSIIFSRVTRPLCCLYHTHYSNKGQYY